MAIHDLRIRWRRRSALIVPLSAWCGSMCREHAWAARLRTQWVCTLAALLTLQACERQPLDSEPNGPAADDSVITGYRAVPGWPQLETVLRLGEVAGIDVDVHGHVFLFQRAERGWDTETLAPIEDATVWQLDAASGRLLHAWGARAFRLPHGLTVDANNNIWLTDAALHQVFQFSHDGAPLKQIGEASVGRWDAGHFNRPTDVAVSVDGRIYVSDGYENQRVVAFDSTGRYVREWGRRGAGDGEFALPHGLAMRGGSLYVADRENGRVVGFDGNGAYQSSQSPIPGALVYAVTASSPDELLVAVRQDAFGLGGVVVFDASGRITHGLGAVPLGDGTFLFVHDIARANDGTIYVAETRTGGVRKYEPVRAAR